MESIMPPSKPTVGIVIDEENESVYGTEYEAYTHWAVCAATTMTGRDLLASVERYKTQVVEDSTYKEPLTRDALSRAIIATVKKMKNLKMIQNGKFIAFDAYSNTTLVLFDRAV